LSLWFFVLSAVLLTANPVRAGARYYMLIFGAQTHPKIPRKTHTFATIVKVADAPPGCAEPGIEVYTISWLPQTLKVKPFRLHDEPGYNLKLEETLKWAAKNHMQVTEWGPFVIDEDFYWRVYREHVRFESGGYRYKAVDSANRGSRTSDCIHAVTDIDRRDPRTSYSVINSGDRVTRKFVQILLERGRLVIPPDDVSWIDAALGLDCYPIVHCPSP
jgi:hypothetical protein